MSVTRYGTPVRRHQLQFIDPQPGDDGSRPLAAAVAALLTEVIDEESQDAVVKRYPELVELSGLTALTAGVEKALTRKATELHANLLLSHLLGLVSLYYNAHSEVTNGAEQVAYIDVLSRLRAAAVELNQLEMAEELRIGLSYASTALGCYYSDNDDREGAIEAYTFALTHTPEDALIYRNRALEYLALGNLDAASADLEQAGTQEPDSSALHRLWCELLATAGNGPAMQPHVVYMLNSDPDDAVTFFYLALYGAFTGQPEDDTVRAMDNCAHRASREQVVEGVATLDRLIKAHPAYRTPLQTLRRVLDGQPAGVAGP